MEYSPVANLLRCYVSASGRCARGKSGLEAISYVLSLMQWLRTSHQPIKGTNGTKLLTKREEELVHLVAEGLTNRDISRQLSLTEHTVRNYLFRIFNKLGTSNRLELALYVIKQKEPSEAQT